MRQSGGQLDLVQFYPRLIEGQLSAEASQMTRRQAALSPSSPTVCLGGRLGAGGMDGCLVLTVPPSKGISARFVKALMASLPKLSRDEAVSIGMSWAPYLPWYVGTTHKMCLRLDFQVNVS